MGDLGEIACSILQKAKLANYILLNATADNQPWFGLFRQVVWP